MKIFISQPMRDKTKEEIYNEREKVIEYIMNNLSKEFEILDTVFKGLPKDTKPLVYISKSIEILAQADILLLVGEWETYRGCLIEKICADAYGIKSLDLNGLLD